MPVLMLALLACATCAQAASLSPSFPAAGANRNSANSLQPGRITPILNSPAFVATPVASGFGLRNPLKANRVLCAARHIKRQAPVMISESQEERNIWSELRLGDAMKGGVGTMLAATVALGLILAPGPSSAATPEAPATPVEKTVKDKLAGEALSLKISEKTDLLKEILQDIYSGYVDPVDIDKLSETAFNAMLNSLDPFTEFENAQAAKEMRVQVGGKYAGVGMSVAKIPSIGTDRDPALRVVNAQQGYAFDKGVRVGDRLVAIDGADVTKLDAVAATDLLDGKPGTSVKLKLMRDGWDLPKEVVLTREEVVLPEVPLAMILDSNKKLGYVALSGFSQYSASELASALVELQRDGPLSSLILDLRGNPGGLLGSAVDVANLFVPKGTPIVSTKGRLVMPTVGDSDVKAKLQAQDFDQTYYAEYPPLVPRSTRIVVLVNGETASAAEIVSGALQDHDRAAVVGEKTFGKGLVQQIQRLSQPGTQIKLTIAKYYTPSGRCIQSKSYKQAGVGRYGTVEERFSEASQQSFKTDGGRLVRSAGGIEPDVVVKSRSRGMLERDLLEKNAFFQWAGEWEKFHALEGEQMSKAGNIAVVTDEMYDGFVRFVKDHFPLASGPFDPALDKLKEALAELGYAEANPDVDLLKQHMAQLTEAEFYKNKEALRRHLQAALNERFLPAAYKYASSLQGDEQLKAAIQLATSGNQYSSIVKPDALAGAKAAGSAGVSPSLSVQPEE